VSSRSVVISVAVQWSSTSCRSLMFLLCLSVLSCRGLSALSFLELEFSWSVFPHARSTKSPLLILGQYMSRPTVDFVLSGFLLWFFLVDGLDNYSLICFIVIPLTCMTRLASLA
jgi:hypothetical protein